MDNPTQIPTPALERIAQHLARMAETLERLEGRLEELLVELGGKKR